jgi:F0F1-type ATP synthase epsilon subunit
MPELLRLNVVTPVKTLLDVAQVRKVRLKLADHGWLSIYPYHAPLLAETVAGPVTYITEAAEASLALAESILQVAENQVTLFTAGEVADFTMATASAAAAAEDGRFDRLARVLLKSMGATPGDEWRDFDPEVETPP